MRSAQLHSPVDIRGDPVEGPSLRDGWVRFDIEYIGICGSDVHEYESGPVPIQAEDSDHRIPRKEWNEHLLKHLGHKIAGTVSEVGAHVEDASVSDRVPLSLVFSCDECRYFAEGKYQLCERMFGSAVGSPSFSESMKIPAENPIPIPGGVSFRHVGLVEPLRASLHRVNRAGVSLGDSVAVFGAGSIGLGILAVARTAGARRVFVSEPLAPRRASRRGLRTRRRSGGQSDRGRPMSGLPGRDRRQRRRPVRGHGTGGDVDRSPPDDQVRRDGRRRGGAVHPNDITQIFVRA